MDMQEEMDEFLKFATETLGLSEEQYGKILGERKTRGGALSPFPLILSCPCPSKLIHSRHRKQHSSRDLRKRRRSTSALPRRPLPLPLPLLLLPLRNRLQSPSATQI